MDHAIIYVEPQDGGKWWSVRPQAFDENGDPLTVFDDDIWQEAAFDLESQAIDHAKDIADHAVQKHGAKSACVRMYNPKTCMNSHPYTAVRPVFGAANGRVQGKDILDYFPLEDSELEQADPHEHCKYIGQCDPHAADPSVPDCKRWKS